MGNDNLEIFSNDPRLKGFGYIPGGYMWGKCRGCKNQLIGVAKYSTRCFECASKLLRKKLEMIEADILLSCNESAKTALGYDPSKAWNTEKKKDDSLEITQDDIRSLGNLIDFLGEMKGEIESLCVNPGRLQETIEAVARIFIVLNSEEI